MNRARLAKGAGCLLPLALLVAAACGDDDAGTLSGPAVDADAAVRPEVTFTAGGSNLDIPEEVPSGFVDIRVKAVDGEGDSGAHLLIGRVNDDVTDEEFNTALADDNADLFQFVDVVGGNGTVHTPDETLMTLDLTAGRYIAINIYFPTIDSPPQFADSRFTVVDQGNDAPPPQEKGTITLGPDMRLTVPEDFDGHGVWRFENLDPELAHEAALVGLAPGKTSEDVVNWFHTQDGPIPIVGEFGSMGAIGPDNEAWIDFDATHVEPGDYSMVCFLPGSDGLPHVFNGMIADVTVGGRPS
jgi:hypothetical protein